MLKTYSYYDSSTGLFTGKQVRCEEAAIDASKLPPGIQSLEGVFDRMSQRVDVASGNVVAYQPPAVSEEYEWNAHSRSWQLKRVSTDPQQRRAQLIAHIQSLEVRQGRALREATLGDAGAFHRLRQIDETIKGLRSELA